MLDVVVGLAAVVAGRVRLERHGQGVPTGRSGVARCLGEDLDVIRPRLASGDRDVRELAEGAGSAEIRAVGPVDGKVVVAGDAGSCIPRHLDRGGISGVGERDRVLVDLADLINVSAELVLDRRRGSHHVRELAGLGHDDEGLVGVLGAAVHVSADHRSCASTEVLPGISRSAGQDAERFEGRVVVHQRAGSALKRIEVRGEVGLAVLPDLGIVVDLERQAGGMARCRDRRSFLSRTSGDRHGRATAHRAIELDHCPVVSTTRARRAERLGRLRPPEHGAARIHVARRHEPRQRWAWPVVEGESEHEALRAAERGRVAAEAVTGGDHAIRCDQEAGATRTSRLSLEGFVVGAAVAEREWLAALEAVRHTRLVERADVDVAGRIHAGVTAIAGAGALHLRSVEDPEGRRGHRQLLGEMGLRELPHVLPVVGPDDGVSRLSRSKPRIREDQCERYPAHADECRPSTVAPGGDRGHSLCHHGVAEDAVAPLGPNRPLAER